ncbi:hypothetical protein BJ508DRAFT_19616 [Ascobolus immersus RN42]|uniref:Uncharacterized protein n=1 Tax=Ascobolus immersus RN42 TaxID=1160509 RepID=A0A3N4HU12_ASCIM|nr:hypothetical protein BJ508DRAFT_19616 [Ascobolus immersus RN42]
MGSIKAAGTRKLRYRVWPCCCEKCCDRSPVDAYWGVFHLSFFFWHFSISAYTFSLPSFVNITAFWRCIIDGSISCKMMERCGIKVTDGSICGQEGGGYINKALACGTDYWTSCVMWWKDISCEYLLDGLEGQEGQRRIFWAQDWLVGLNRDCVWPFFLLLFVETQRNEKLFSSFFFLLLFSDFLLLSTHGLHFPLFLAFLWVLLFFRALAALAFFSLLFSLSL